MTRKAHPCPTWRWCICAFGVASHVSSWCTSYHRWTVFAESETTKLCKFGHLPQAFCWKNLRFSEPQIVTSCGFSMQPLPTFSFSLLHPFCSLECKVFLHSHLQNWPLKGCNNHRTDKITIWCLYFIKISIWVHLLYNFLILFL